MRAWSLLALGSLGPPCRRFAPQVAKGAGGLRVAPAPAVCLPLPNPLGHWLARARRRCGDALSERRMDGRGAPEPPGPAERLRELSIDRASASSRAQKLPRRSLWIAGGAGALLLLAVVSM